jgi:4-methylaminobutanoate oxidase (formaldehyde-forming)
LGVRQTPAIHEKLLSELESQTSEPGNPKSQQTLDDPAVVLVGRETILRDGQPVGYLTSGGYGYTIGKSVGYGYVRNASGVSDAFLTSGSYALVVASETYPAEITLDAPFDPTNSRVKA